MKHVIITSSDKSYGDFLVRHWLPSLQENVNLSNIDVVVIDYGLSKANLSELNKHGVLVVKGREKGHVVTTRFIDLGRFLKKSHYDQVLCIDGGDIIFQKDFSQLFNEDKNYFRIVKLDLENLYFEYFIPKNFSSDVAKKLRSVLVGKPVLNAGVIFSSRNNCILMCNEIQKLVRMKNAYGPDQIVVNYVIYKMHKLKLLSNLYNFMPGLAQEKIRTAQGVCFREDGKKIFIVHNSGREKFFRSIKDFGYGKKYNHVDSPTYYLKRTIYGSFRMMRPLFLYASRWVQHEDSVASHVV